METLKPYAIKIMIDIYKKAGLEVPLVNGQPYITNDHIISNVSKLYEYINNGQYAHTTKRDYLIILSNIFKKSQPGLHKYIYDQATHYNNLYREKELNQELDANEQKNYIKYNELFLKLNDLVNTYNSNKTLKNILNLVILALYVLQPPLRNDYNNLLIIRNEDDEKSKNRNYLLIAHDMYYVIINKDKVSKTHGRAVIPIMNDTLINILNIYFESYATNNKYLLENPNGTPYTKRQVQYIINNLFDNKVLNIYNLRSAYITNYYKNCPSLKDKKLLAHQMRHTELTAELVYCKYF